MMYDVDVTLVCRWDTCQSFLFSSKTWNLGFSLQEIVQFNQCKINKNSALTAKLNHNQKLSKNVFQRYGNKEDDKNIFHFMIG